MAERLPFGEIRPTARPIGAFAQPGQAQVAGAARPDSFQVSAGVTTIQRSGVNSVQGVNQYEQLATALAPFSRQLMDLTNKGIMAYAEGKIEEGYYLEAKNQQAKASLSLQMQQEAGAAQAASTVSALAKKDPAAGALLTDNNPFRLIGRRRYMAQMAASDVPAVLQGDLATNQAALAGLKPGSPELTQRRVQLTNQLLGYYGLSPDDPEANFYVTPAINRSWEAYATEQRKMWSKELTRNTADAASGSVIGVMRDIMTTGVMSADGRRVMPGQPGFGLLSGLALTAEIDRGLSVLAGEDKTKALEQVKGVLGFASRNPVLAQMINEVRLGSSTDPMDKRPRWVDANPVELLTMQNTALQALNNNYEQKQKNIEQTLDGLWLSENGPGAPGVKFDSEDYQQRVKNFRQAAIDAGYREPDAYIQKRYGDGATAATAQFGATVGDESAVNDWLNSLTPSDLSPQNIGRTLKKADQLAASIEPTNKGALERAKELRNQIRDKEKLFADLPSGVFGQIKNELKQDMGLSAIKALDPKGEAASLLMQPGMSVGGAMAAAPQKLTSFTIDLENLYTRAVQAEISEWRGKHPGVGKIPDNVQNVLTSQAIAKARKSPEYSRIYEEAVGRKPGEVGEPTTRRPQAPGPDVRGVSRSEAASLPASTVKGFAVRPVMNAPWIRSELKNIENGRAISSELYGLARKAGTTTNRYLLEQLRFYTRDGVNQIDPTGAAQKYLQEQIRKERANQTVSNANYQATVSSRGYDSFSPGSWLMNMVMPPAAAATLPPSYSRYGGGGGRVTSVVGDRGGLAATVSAGEGGWNSVNYGTTGSASSMPLTSMTIGQVEAMQARGKVFAVGAYQFTPGVLARARRDAGLSPSEPMSPENQTKLFWGLAMGGKRPALAAYLRGQSNDINAAHRDLSMEWAGVAGPNGRGYYDGDSAGNRASVGAARVRQALMAARRQLSGG